MIDLEKLFGSDSSRTVLTTYSPESDTPEPFAFVLDVAELVDSAVEVAPGHTLRRAADAQVKFAKELIESLFGRHFNGALWETRKPRAGIGKYITLPAKQWRYFVIEFNDDDQDLECLERALTVATCDLQIGFVLSRITIESLVLPACVYRPPQLFQSLSTLSDSGEGSFKVVSKVDGAQISEVYTRLRAYDHKILDLRRIFRLLSELRDLPHFSPLQILGYFAILESILTHQPNTDDPYDSITRQITRKLSLLNNRWQPLLNYSSFGEVTHEKLWSKMYAYRSAIAHGAKPDFGSQLSVLGSAKNADLLIKETVKRTIRYCLIEPQLVADLHNC